MSIDRGKAGLTAGQYRILAVGFCLPVGFGGFGLGIGLHALIDPRLDYFAYVVSLPAIALVWFVQYRLWRATGTVDAAARRLALARIRLFYRIPFIVVAVALLLTGGLLAAGRPVVPTGVPLHALLVASLVLAVIAACSLPLTVRGMSYLRMV